MAAPWLPRSRAHCFELYLRGGGTTRESDEREMHAYYLLRRSFQQESYLLLSTLLF
jgi:hypothetical protein